MHEMRTKGYKLFASRLITIPNNPIFIDYLIFSISIQLPHHLLQTYPRFSIPKSPYSNVSSYQYIIYAPYLTCIKEMINY